LVEEVGSLAAPEAGRQGVKVEMSPSPVPLPVRADADLIKQALLNVVLNGLQSMSTGGVLAIATRRNEVSASIEVRDQGGGIPTEIRDKSLISISQRRSPAAESDWR
jgi:signal transduction histidine kinase